MEPQLDQFATEVIGLGAKLGAVLIQLPPSLTFDPVVAGAFFSVLRSLMDATIVCEPRHPTWFTPEAESLLIEHSIGRVAADPSVVPIAATPGGCKQNLYFRWHGSPRKYYSTYDNRTLIEFAHRVVGAAQAAGTVWCIFDNTAEGAAFANALTFAEMIASGV